jgi:RNA polymerase sigma-70 factor (ECF subfamily)
MALSTPNWSSIVEEHAERVFRIAYRILGSVHDAEDVSQNVFAEAFKVHQTGAVQTMAGLLVRLSTLRSIDQLRSRKELVPVSSVDHVSNHGPAEEVAGKELAAWLRDATGKLPEQQAAVFSLTHYEQLGRNEVAAILSIAPESVSSALYKARQNLESQLTVFNGGVQ